MSTRAALLAGAARFRDRLSVVTDGSPVNTSPPSITGNRQARRDGHRDLRNVEWRGTDHPGTATSLKVVKLKVKGCHPRH
jgi:hypothetical protein